MNLLFNITDLKELLINFYTLTKMRVAIFDDNYHEIASYPSRLSTYCHIIREDPAIHQKCTLCDYEAFQKCKDSHNLYLYQCHAGLTEAIVPIFADNIIIGYIMMGQVLNTHSKTALWNEIIPSLKNYNINLDTLHKAFMNKRNVSTNTIESAAKMMEICSSFLYTSHKLILKEDSLAQKIDTFIGENLEEELSVQLICEKFDIRKTNLYKLSNKSYGMGISKHINQIRIQRAKKYLMDTTLPIFQIAEMVGIYDYNYFTKMFKKETSVTPKSYRDGTVLPPKNNID
ncbi:PocR ligand-binding domain-containing protein [Clostridium grantii]|uniref:AraC-type DNA-binding protein n=1 Tax=Clostridium grantii DSM 8605 TaxID=1121316 RepID=A0A1M5WFB0_9CLOT|nr:PocR ligand-binding domain-containing protein [Clostridium grantii]SHH86117.1 AraC-type DNA-binding protein [Clostridium grantii DSM 8605]